MTDYLETAEHLKPGQTIEVEGEKWLVLRVAGKRAEIKLMGEGEKPKPLPNRKERQAEIRLRTRKAKKLRKAKKGRVG